MLCLPGIYSSIIIDSTHPGSFRDRSSLILVLNDALISMDTPPPFVQLLVIRV